MIEVRKTPRRILVLLLLFISLTLSACGTLQGDRAFYLFGYSASSQTPWVSVLDYQYFKGDKVIRGVTDSQKSTPGFDGVGGSSIGGRLLVGDRLYVKWREKDTGVVREANVDLTNRFPSDLDDKSVHFVIGADDVHVYVASLKGRPTTVCPARYKERAADPRNPDLIARSYFCGKDLQKVYPEQKQMD